MLATEVHELMMSQRRNLRGPDVWGQNKKTWQNHPKKHIDGADPSWWFFDVFFHDVLICFVSTYIFSSPFGFEMLWEWCQMLWFLDNSRIEGNIPSILCTPSEALCRQFVNSRWFVRSPVAGFIGFITIVRVLIVESCASTCFTRCFTRCFKCLGAFVSTCFNMFRHVSTLTRSGSLSWWTHHLGALWCLRLRLAIWTPQGLLSPKCQSHTTRWPSLWLPGGLCWLAVLGIWHIWDIWHFFQKKSKKHWNKKHEICSPVIDKNTEKHKNADKNKSIDIIR